MPRPRADWPSARADPTTDAPCWPCCPGRREAGRGRALLSSGRGGKGGASSCFCGFVSSPHLHRPSRTRLF